MNVCDDESVRSLPPPNAQPGPDQLVPAIAPTLPLRLTEPRPERLPFPTFFTVSTELPLTPPTRA